MEQTLKCKRCEKPPLMATEEDWLDPTDKTYVFSCRCWKTSESISRESARAEWNKHQERPEELSIE